MGFQLLDHLPLSVSNHSARAKKFRSQAILCRQSVSIRLSYFPRYLYLMYLLSVLSSDGTTFIFTVTSFVRGGSMMLSLVLRILVAIAALLPRLNGRVLRALGSATIIKR
jgi:hypothetical protein